MDGGVLHVVPAALRAAAGVVAGHAEHVVSAVGLSGMSSEAVAVAAAAFGGAFGGYRGEFLQRLSVASAALAAAADAFAVMEEANSAALTSIAPRG